MYAGALVSCYTNNNWFDLEGYKQNGLATMFNIIEQKSKDYVHIRKQIYKNRYKRK